MFLMILMALATAEVVFAIWYRSDAQTLERARRKAAKRPRVEPAYDPQMELYRASDGTITQVPVSHEIEARCPPVSWRDNRDDYVAPAIWSDPSPPYDTSPSYSSSCDTSSYSDSSSSSDCGSSSCSCD